MNSVQFFFEIDRDLIEAIFNFVISRFIGGLCAMVLNTKGDGVNCMEKHHLWRFLAIFWILQSARIALESLE